MYNCFIYFLVFSLDHLIIYTYVRSFTHISTMWGLKMIEKVACRNSGSSIVLALENIRLEWHFLMVLEITKAGSGV